MKNKLISQKTRSRASKVVLALFLCTIMISSLCSFTVGETFTFPETPPEYDYQTYQQLDSETDKDFKLRVLSYGSYTGYFTDNTKPFIISVPFYLVDSGNTTLTYIYSVNGMYLFADYADDVGRSFAIESYTNNDYTVSFLKALGFETPTPTESLTNVWDGILNWITTSISSLQNVFWQEGTVIDFNSDVDTSDAITINDTVLYKSPVEISDIPDGDVVFVYDGTSFTEDQLTFDDVSLNNVTYGYYSIDGTILFAHNYFGGEFYTNTDLNYYLFYGDSAGLTLLGTLCCIAVAISVVFLLIGTIVNFLKLRS